ncbi:hypothetical protein GOB93_19850 [Acetobacter musti]|uniref:Uncharacterized protein n=1 Tax=Acetobacter musti TaxID=864732 RepID=A0ABX0JUB0_9PROT|nr:hypothetical protein [Acetobacter musti]NHN86834.1 hypothetical protein [Acetobacter musti]
MTEAELITSTGIAETPAWITARNQDALRSLNLLYAAVALASGALTDDEWVAGCDWRRIAAAALNGAAMNLAALMGLGIDEQIVLSSAPEYRAARRRVVQDALALHLSEPSPSRKKRASRRQL